MTQLRICLAWDDHRVKPNRHGADAVSFVMPVLNELDYLETAVASVLQQEVPGASELILALGPSSDGTTELAERIAAADPRVRVVYNPQAHIPVGLNLAIRASKYPIIVRVDAHSELAPGYTVQAIKTLHRTGAANVGGIMHAQGRNPFQRAAAWAYNSRVGLGGGAYHGGDEEQEAESAYLGVMRREAIESVGLFDESVRRGEDWELNLRLRQAGFRVWFDPALSVTYWPRESPLRLARQFRATGTWRGELVRRYGRSNSIRFFAPPLLFIALIIAVVVAIAQVTGLFSGPWLLWSSIVYVPLALYVLLIAATACVPDAGAHAVRRGLRGRLWTLAVLPTMHLSWGCGFLIGVMHGAHDTVDASRLGTRNTPLP